MVSGVKYFHTFKNTEVFFLPELSHLSWEVAKSCHFLALQKVLLLESNQFNFVQYLSLNRVFPIFEK